MSYVFVPNFEAIAHVTLVLELENRPASLAQKAISVKNGLSRAKNISYGCVCLPIPFYPNQPTFGRDEVFPFFSSSEFLYALLLKSTLFLSKSNFYVKPVVPERAGGRGTAAPLPFYQEGQGG